MKKKIFCILFILLVGFSTQVFAEFNGYQDLRFGMTPERVKQTVIGETKRVNIFGRSRPIKFDYENNKLTKIDIWFSELSILEFETIRSILKERYGKAYRPSNIAIKLYNQPYSEVNSINFGFGDNQVLMQLVREIVKDQVVMHMHLVYQNQELASTFTEGAREIENYLASVDKF